MWSCGWMHMRTIWTTLWIIHHQTPAQPQSVHHCSSHVKSSSLPRRFAWQILWQQRVCGKSDQGSALTAERLTRQKCIRSSRSPTVDRWGDPFQIPPLANDLTEIWPRFYNQPEVRKLKLDFAPTESVQLRQPANLIRFCIIELLVI